MPRTPYTCADSEAIQARLDHDLVHVVRAVRATDPHLRSLVLTGAFARGEGAVLNGVPQDDYELVAIRSLGTPRSPYARLRPELERALGLHIDLTTVSAWRLPWAPPSIFWYETALRGRTLWGDPLLGRLGVRDGRRIDPAEGARLLVNRAAGLLRVKDSADPHARRLQAANGLLEVLDSRLLGFGSFPPSRTERWARARQMHREKALPTDLLRLWPWLSWAFAFRLDPGNAPKVDPARAWTAAARAVLRGAPHAARHAGVPSLAPYGRLGGVPMLALLEASLRTTTPPVAARRRPVPLARVDARPLRLLEILRRATGQ